MRGNRIRGELLKGTTSLLMPGAPDWVMDYVPDPAYSTPAAVVPVNVMGDPTVVHFDVGHSRTSRWLVFLTGVDDQGIRYQLDWPRPWTTSISGTVWDWLTAGR